ncbi:DUF3592 domain-containing protein [Streptomyces marispadix]|uniref:DUF3592 domain-containing protein n=1 Tax=Streptomyces marispadix TaxID=2922868 RepID=A0ABS9SZ87_9ACTN|nr:DUF3592 domain-containing protein [Streptomyces marispadix]MCH6161590.1 DUF3592 domain-containing protein [Streptomyces marispadix]
MVDAGISFWICLAGAVSFSGVLCLEARSVLRLRREGVRAEGTVVDNVEKAEPRRRRWVPVIAFTDAEGYHVEFVSRVQSGRSLPLGRTVSVIYPRENPWAARIDRWADLWLGVTLLVVMLAGDGWALIGLGMQVAAEGGV